MPSTAQTFKTDAARVAADLQHRDLIQTSLHKYEVVRDRNKKWFQDWQGARQLAAETKWLAVNQLDRRLEEFAGKLEARGAKVHWAGNGQQACEIILGILRQKNAKM